MGKSKYEDIRKKIKGPVYPIPPAFNKDYSIDYKSVARYVEFLNSHNVRTLLVTAGTSRLNLLSNDEIKELNRIVVEANQDKALVIVATPMFGPTSKSIEFAQHAQEIGADGILLYYPERYYDDNKLYDHFKSVACSADIAILIHGIPMRNAYATISATALYSIDLYKRLSKLGNIIGIKEESGNETYRYKLATNMRGKMSLIVSPASMRMFLSCVLFGVDAYLVGIGSFVPEIEEKYYSAVLKGNYKKALYFVTEYEEPFFDVAFPMGWHIAMKGVMNLLNLFPITERPPLQQADNKELTKLKKVMKKIGVL